MADVQLNWNAVSGLTFKVEHKKNTDVSWTLDVTGLALTTYTITGLDGSTLYNFRVTSICPSGTLGTPVTVNQTTNPDTTLVWIEDTFTCEQDEPLTLEDTYTGFSSPQGLFFDETLQRYYVVDADDSTANVWWFDPATMTGTASRNYVSGTAVTGGLVQSWDFVPSLRKIYMAGPNTGGVVVHNIGTGATATIPTGTNGAFQRLLTKYVNGIVYSSNAADATLVLINPNTDTITSTVNVNTIPGNTSNQYFNNAYTLNAVNGEIWVCAASRASSGNIARYNSTLTTLLGTITITGASTISGGTWGGRYWQTVFFDEDNNKFYLHDIGSNTTTIIDTTTNTIDTQITVDNLQGKTHVNIGWNINPLTDQMYANRSNLNDPSDGSQIQRFYIADRVNYAFESMYLNQSTAALTFRTGTNEFWAVNPGLFQWSVPNTGYATDGEVFKYTT